jgi:hypothetical protein
MIIATRRNQQVFDLEGALDKFMISNSLPSGRGAPGNTYIASVGQGLLHGLTEPFRGIDLPFILRREERRKKNAVM